MPENISLCVSLYILLLLLQSFRFSLLPISSPRKPTQEEVFLPVTVYVQDVNDHAPEFQNTPYHLEVDELTPVGVTVFRGIHAIDRDKPNTANSDITYSIVVSILTHCVSAPHRFSPLLLPFKSPFSSLSFFSKFHRVKRDKLLSHSLLLI